MHLVNVLGIYRYRTTETGKYVKKLSLNFPELKTKLKNSYWFVFYDHFCLGRWSRKNYAFFLGHIALSQPVLKVMS